MLINLSLNIDTEIQGGNVFTINLHTIHFYFERVISETMANQNAKGFKRLINACIFSVAGFKATWEHEEAFRQEVILFLITTPLAIWLGETDIEKLLLIGSIVLVMLVELLNTAVEAVVDRVGFEHHELSGRAKDIGSAAVMMSLTWAAVTWALILL